MAAKQKKPGGKGRLLRFLLRHWALWLLMILLPLTALNVYLMWRGGLVVASSLLSPFFTNLILIVAVLVLRRVIQLWNEGYFSRVIQQSLTQGQAVVKDKMAAATGALSSFGSDIKGSLSGLLDGSGPSKGPAVAAAPRCPSCGRLVRPEARFCEVCGSAIPAAAAPAASNTCPKCGKPVRPQARFCEGCGAALTK
ncbi:MAG TPA: zinc ribbon domain-containing protein [Anaerolineae bacterium]|nr:zinc ribbon domain-containing protein [Anaerolineae bacterium]